MRLYSCKLRLKNSLYNEVPKINVTAAEIMVLQYMHMPDGGPVDPSTVTEIKHIGDVERTDAEERARLSHIYDNGLKRTDQSIAKMFGVGTALPKVVEGVDELPAEPVKRGRKSATKDKAAAAS